MHTKMKFSACWAHASDGSRVSCTKHGFKKVGDLILDVGHDKDGKWGLEIA